VGIEFDRRDGGPWADIPHWLQFCQWTIAAAPGHPVFKKMVNRVLNSVEDLSINYGLPVNKLHPESFEVMNSTGPAAWTDIVFEQLQEYNPKLKDTKDLSFMTEPTLIGDILIHPIDGFGMGQDHSASTNDGSIPEAAVMKHLFTGSWRGD
jgi:alpha 1,6-mannosyltransferase